MLPKVDSDEYIIYNPYRTFKKSMKAGELLFGAGQMGVNSIEKKVISKLLFASANTVFTLELSDTLYNGWNKYTSENLEKALMRQMIKHTVENPAEIEKQIIDIIILFWYQAYIPIEEQFKTMENLFRLNVIKTIGKSFVNALKERDASKYLETYIEERDMERYAAGAYTLQRTSLSICVYLYHLKHYGVLEKDVDFYYNWLIDSGYKWFHLPSTINYDSIQASLNFIIPKKIKDYEGKKLGIIYKYFERYSDSFLKTYNDCDRIPFVIDKILKHSKRKVLLPWNE